MVDDSLVALWCEKEAGLPPPVVGLVQEPLADLEEGWPVIRNQMPTVRHEVKQDVRTVLRPLHLVPVLHVLHDLHIREMKIIVFC